MRFAEFHAGQQITAGPCDVNTCAMAARLATDAACARASAVDVTTIWFMAL